MEGVTRTYFDIIPLDVQRRILTFTDIHNQHELQRGRVSGSRRRGDILHLERELVRASLFFSIHSPFYDVAVRMFSVLILGDRTSIFELHARDGIIKVSPELSRGEKMNVNETIVLRTFRACGAMVRKIVFRNVKDEYESCVVMLRFVGIVAHHCTNVQHLVLNTFSSFSIIRDACNVLLRAFAKQLISISCNSFDNTSSSSSSSSLLDFSICKRVKCFHYEGNYLNGLQSMWNAIGKTVEEVSILCVKEMDGYEQLLNVIRENCRCLTVLLLDSRNIVGMVGEIEYIALLVSYGEQLNRVNVDGLSTEGLSNVIGACPNARFSWFGHGDNNTWKSVQVLGSQMDYLVLNSFLSRSIDWELYSNVMVWCTNLRKLLISTDMNRDQLDNGVINMALKSIFRLPYHSLEEITLRGVIVTQQVARMMALSTSNLRVLVVDKDSFIESGSTFNIIVDSNLMLQKVKLKANFISHLESNLMTRPHVLDLILTKFFECRKLKVLNLDFMNCNPCDLDMSELYRKCQALQYRGTTIKICYANRLGFESY